MPLMMKELLQEMLSRLIRASLRQVYVTLFQHFALEQFLPEMVKEKTSSTRLIPE